MTTMLFYDNYILTTLLWTSILIMVKDDSYCKEHFLPDTLSQFDATLVIILHIHKLNIIQMEVFKKISTLVTLLESIDSD